MNCLETLACASPDPLNGLGPLIFIVGMIGIALAGVFGWKMADWFIPKAKEASQ